MSIMHIDIVSNVESDVFSFNFQEQSMTIILVLLYYEFCIKLNICHISYKLFITSIVSEK